MNKSAILVSRDRSGDWCEWRPVRVVSEDRLTWRIWSWRNPLTRLVHKRALGERIEIRGAAEDTEQAGDSSEETNRG